MLRRQGQCFINLCMSQMAFLSKSVLETLDYRHKKMNRIVVICFKRALRLGVYNESQLQPKRFSPVLLFQKSRVAKSKEMARICFILLYKSKQMVYFFSFF